MKTEHLLIIRFSAMGDVAMTVPVIYSLAQQYPQLRISVLSRPYAQAFFDNLAPNVDFMAADLKHEYRKIRGLNKLYRRLTAKQFTAVADFHDTLRSKYLRMRFFMDRFKVAHIDKHRSEKRELIDHQNKVLKPIQSAFQNYADVLSELGYPIKLNFNSIFPTNNEAFSSLIPKIGNYKENEKWIGLAPFAAHTGKIYPLTQMEQTLQGLLKKYPTARIFLFGGSNQEKKVFLQWTKKYPSCTVVPTTLYSLQEELILMSRLDVMISMDSANMHLASLVNTPVVSIWGATHPYAGFMGWNQSIENAVQTDLPCRPCSIYGEKPCRRKDYACLYQIKPEQIIQQVDKILSRKDKLH